MESKPEHTCSLCSNPEIAEKLLQSKTIPFVLCEGVVEMADGRGDYRFGHLKERADKQNRSRTPEQRVAELVKEIRERLGHTSSSRGFIKDI